MKAAIVTIGTEILLGDIVDSNSRYISLKLAELGMGVYKHISVGDNPARLRELFEKEFQWADMIITTGGLGPTTDDISKEIAAEYAGKKMVLHEETLEKLKKLFQRRNWNMTENNTKQAYSPEDSIILENKKGTAPGCIIEMDGGKYIILMPGPPTEMKSMFENSVIPYLRKFQTNIIYSEIVRTYGLGESAMESAVQDLVEKSENPTIAPYAGFGESVLRITSRAETEEKAKKLIEPVKNEIYNRIGDYIYGEGEAKLPAVASALLLKKKVTIAVAESCTGGLLSSLLIDYPGISSVFLEGMVTYSNESKIKNLNVSEDILQKYGAVSEECALAMASGLAEFSGADMVVTTTGVAGPGGGTEEKPVGLVWFGLWYKGKTRAFSYKFGGDRLNIRNRAALHAVDAVRKVLLEDDMV